MKVKNAKFDFHVGNLNGKRLLVLGCANNAQDIRSFADKEGVIIVVSYPRINPKIGAIADECYSEELKGKDQLISFIREH